MVRGKWKRDLGCVMRDARCEGRKEGCCHMVVSFFNFIIEIDKEIERKGFREIIRNTEKLVKMKKNNKTIKLDGE